MNHVRSSKERELPEAITCAACGRDFDFLPSHLNGAHKMTAGQYRDAESLAPSVPLFSQKYSAITSRNASTPTRILKSVNIRNGWRVRIQKTFDLLAQEGIYTPVTAAAAFGIPSRTLYSAVSEGRLPAGLGCLLLPARGISLGAKYNKIHILINVEDLRTFKQSYHPKLKP